MLKKILVCEIQVPPNDNINLSSHEILNVWCLSLIFFSDKMKKWRLILQEINQFNQEQTEVSLLWRWTTFSFIMESLHIFSPSASGTVSMPISLAL